MLGRARVTGPSHLTTTSFPVRDKGDEDDFAIALDGEGLKKVYKGREVSDFAISRTNSQHFTSSEHFHNSSPRKLDKFTKFTSFITLQLVTPHHCASTLDHCSPTQSFARLQTELISLKHHVLHLSTLQH